MTDTFFWLQFTEELFHQESASDNTASMSPQMVVTLLDGRWQPGSLERINLEQGFIDFLPKRSGAVTRIAFASIGSIRFATPIARASLPALIALETRDIRPPDLRRCSIFFHQGQPLVADNAHCIASTDGLFLFWISAVDRVWRWFFPASAIHHYLLGSNPQKQYLPPKPAGKRPDASAGTFLSPGTVVTSWPQLALLLAHQLARPELELGTALVNEGLITPEQLHAACELQVRESHLPLGDILIDMQAVTREIINQLLAQRLGIPFIDIRQFPIDTHWVKAVASDFLPSHLVVPLYKTATTMVVALENPFVTDVLTWLATTTNLIVQPVLTSRADLQFVIEQLCGPLMEWERVQTDTAVASALTDAQAYFDLSRFTASQTDPATLLEIDNLTVLLVDKIIGDAIAQNISNIHIESKPGNQPGRIQFRKQGVISIYSEIPASFMRALRILIQAKSGLALTGQPHAKKGVLQFLQADGTIAKMQVVVLPNASGLEAIVIHRLVPFPDDWLVPLLHSPSDLTLTSVPRNPVLHLLKDGLNFCVSAVRSVVSRH